MLRGYLVSSALLLLVGLCAQEPAYFQQRVDYTIDVQLDDEAHQLDAEMSLLYNNNSPVSLDTIYFHLWPNAYADRSTELSDQLLKMGELDLYFAYDEERGYLEGLDFKVDNQAVSHAYHEGNKEVCYILLPEALEPGASVQISTPFKVWLPSADFSRLGHVGQSYMITQWYPKPAVFDKEGWHLMSYLSMGEFYSEFGSFDVSVTLPSNYLVSATGELQNEEELALLKEISDLTKRGVFNGPDNAFPPSSPETKTLRYIQDGVHDFAWFADKRFNVLNETFKLSSGKDVEAWVFFTNRYKETWTRSLEYVVDGTRHYSDLVGEYPYGHVSVVDGTIAAGGGMEYPMVTIINGTKNDRSLETVIVHEIGHNWFYGILGSNERDHAWMDEGVNSYYEARYFEEKYGAGDGKGPLAMIRDGSSFELQDLAYRYSACRHQDQALSTGSNDFSNLNYGTMVYMKGAQVMEHLQGILGETEFDAAMANYYKDWAFKHPYPEDMQRSLESSTGEDLGWMFDDLIKSNIKVDHRVCGLDPKAGSVHIKSRTAFDGPVPVGFYKDGRLEEVQIATGSESVLTAQGTFDKVKIDPDYRTLQLNRRNDQSRSKGVLRRWELPVFKPALGSGASEQPAVYYMPAIGINANDGLMYGAYFSNTEVLFKDREWTLLPLYGNDELLGMASLRQTIWPSETGFERLDLGFHAQRFGLDDDGTLYTRLRPSLSYSHDPPAEEALAWSLEYAFNYSGLSHGDIGRFETKELGVHMARFDLEQRQGLSEWKAGLSSEFNPDFFKLMLEAKVSKIYNAEGDALSFRLYGGQMNVREGVIPGQVPISALLSLNGQGPLARSDNSSDDYLYEHLLLGRNSDPASWTSNQIIRNRGGFVQPTLLGFSRDWVAAANAEIDLPRLSSISLYGNLGFYGASEDDYRSMAEAGLRLSLVKDILDVSFPIAFSTDIRDSIEFNELNYGEQIRFQLRLEKIKLREIIDNLSF